MDAVSLLITVVRGRRRPLSRPNYRRRSANYRHLWSSAFFNMTPPLSSYGDGDDDGGGGGGSQTKELRR